MSQSDGDLLRALSSGVRSQGLTAAAARPGKGAAGDIDGLDFQSLLAKAKSGTISSGLPVTVSPEAGIELTDEQLGRVAAAADLAQASGASRALVLIDGKAVKLDVGVRTVTGVADMESGKPITGIDAVVNAPGVLSQSPSLVTLPAGASTSRNVSLLKALGAREDHPAR